MKTKTNVSHNEMRMTNRTHSLKVKTGIKAGPGSKGGGEWISNHNETQVRKAR